MRLLLSIVCPLLLILSAAAEDPGKETVARLHTVLLFGTNGDLAELVPEAPLAEKNHANRMALLKNLHFESYGLLGSEVKAVWRSYTNWSSPMKDSKEILLSFEPRSEAEADGVQLDLELWQANRKVMKTTKKLAHGKWLYIAGPEWRGGRLILGVELLPLSKE